MMCTFKIGALSIWDPDIIIIIIISHNLLHFLISADIVVHNLLGYVNGYKIAAVNTFYCWFPTYFPLI